VLVLFKCLPIGQWHGSSAPCLERALKVRPDFMPLCGLDLHAPVSQRAGEGRGVRCAPGRGLSPDRGPKRRSRCATGEEGIDIHAGLQSLADKVPADRAETASCARRPAIAGSRASEKRFDRSISKRRFRIGQCFGTMKRLFGPTGTHARLAIGQNLLEAASRIARNTQTLASA